MDSPDNFAIDDLDRQSKEAIESARDIVAKMHAISQVESELIDECRSENRKNLRPDE